MSPVATTAVDTLAAAEAARRLANPAFVDVFSDATLLDSIKRSRDAPDGPLRSMPFAVKDNIDVAGLPTTVGCPTRTDAAWTSANAVRRLIDAGAIPIGKTNMDQFATGLVGTRSPFGACHCIASPRHISGGSSSGSAVAVAEGIVAFALGTDTAGSGRVPAAFNGLVGVKPTRGLVGTTGVFPACPSLDCVSIFTREVALARIVLNALTGEDPDDPLSRRPPNPLPPGIARVMTTVGIPAGPIDLEPLHAEAWSGALSEAGRRVRLVPVDIAPLLEAARMLYDGPYVAERYAAFGALLEPDGPHLDPVVRRIVLSAKDVRASEVFAAHRRIAELARRTRRLFAGIDAILLPATPGHPTFDEVARDPIGVNGRLGTYTNMANLLDLCAVAIPVGCRADGLPFGVQLLAPAFADNPLLDLAGRLTDPAEDARPDGGPGDGCRDKTTSLAVCGAHMSGEPLNDILVSGGARLERRATTASGYRMVLIDGRIPRPGLIDDGTGPAGGVEVEVWDAPLDLVRRLAVDVESPLRIASVRLCDASVITGYVADPDALGDAPDISSAGGWRGYLGRD